MGRTTVVLRDTPPNRSAPTDTGRAAVVCIPDRGNFDPQVSFRSHQAAEDEHGPRPSFSTWWDWAEEFFREGGAELYVIPVRGPAPVKATANIAGTGTTLIIDADSVGEWGNGAAGGLSYEVINGPINGGTHRVIIVRLGGVEVERTAEFNTQAGGAFVGEYATIRLGGGTGLPNVIANTNLASGTLDRANITQTQIDAAIDSIPSDLGPMQVAAPDWQTEATHEKLLTHCDPATGRNRFAVCDASVAAVTESALKTAAGLLQGHDSGDAGAFMGPWSRNAGTAASGGSSRLVPASAFFCAKCAQVDRDAGPGQAPAGQYGQATSSLITGVAAILPDDFTIAERDAAGVNLLVSQFGGVKFDGNRTLVTPGGADDEWKQIGVARLRMAVIAALKSAGGRFEHIKLTRINIARFDAALDGVMLAMADNFFAADDGSDPGYVVETGEAVNTPESIAAGVLKAAVGFRPAPGADLVTIELTAVGAAAPLT